LPFKRHGNTKQNHVASTKHGNHQTNILRKFWLTSTYGHSQLKTGPPVRSAIHKQLNGRLVLRWVTTWESLLYVL
ncbi:hypothetical protein KCU78_g1155, partial [Aureobasidium melanogenum]